MSQNKQKCVIFWFRRDLRWQDNVGLSIAVQSGFPVLPIYIFDEEQLGYLPSTNDRRIDYIHQAIQVLRAPLQETKKSFVVRKGTVAKVFEALVNEYAIQAVYANEEYEPNLIRRDEVLKNQLAQHGIPFLLSKDHVITAKNDILKADKTPYTVFTPYAKRWRQWVTDNYKKDIENLFATDCLLTGELDPMPTLPELGFQKTDLFYEVPKLDSTLITHYKETKDFPALDGTSHLGMALRYGTISIRACVELGLTYSEAWLSQLIWRDFFTQILYHFPHVTTQSFKPAYDRIQWRNNEEEFERWCRGETGYALVDAGMKQLVATGFMPNRVRMVVASFLCRHLLIDWRWGEAFFATHLNDYDLALNNGNWQWAAGCGCDAAPYFRIFNPITQTLRFDKNLIYIQQWNPTYAVSTNMPIISHEEARVRALETYKKALRGDEE